MIGRDPLDIRDPKLRHLRRPVLLTRVGLVAERATRAFWPLWSVLALALAPLPMGWQDVLPVEAVWSWLVLSVLGAGWALVVGLRRFRWPTEGEAAARVDAALPGRPIASLADRQAIGAGDPASQAVWEAHQRRMAERTRDARPVPPDLRLSARDPYALRYIALLFLAVSLIFGSVWRVGTVGQAVRTGGADLAAGPTWEGWIEPPAYSGLPALYLADLPEGRIAVMPGSRITLRLYAEPGQLVVEETLSARTGDAGSATEPLQRFEVVRPGRLAIAGPGGAEWEVRLLPDLPPQVAFTAPVEARAQGEMLQPFRASDDFGVVAGTARIALDLPRVTRRFGLSADPDPREAIVVDLPLPFSRDRKAIEDRLIEDFSRHPWANLPVTITLSVTDAAGQEGTTPPEAILLPGRRFFQPVARAVIEQRRDLMWSVGNAPRVLRLLRAIGHRPGDLFTSEAPYLRLRFITRELAARIDEGALTPAAVEEIAAALWDLAVQLEEGTLADARERLRRAQERLSEAMRNGATPDEIAELMRELREATNDYLDMLAQQAEPGQDRTDQPDSAQNRGQTITQDQIQALMDRIQDLMEEGRMAEAAELMEQLNQLMENLRVTRGEGGEGRSPGQWSLQDLQESLREQQQLSDEAFRELQDRYNGRQPRQGQQGQPGQQGQQGQPGEQGQPGQPGQDPSGRQQGEGAGRNDDPGRQDGQGQGGEGEAGDRGSLADRQQALRRELQRQRGELPGLTGEAAEAARGALERAEGAMDRAEEALRRDDLAGAIADQAEAMNALRDGLRNLGEALARNGREEQQEGQAAEGQALGRVEPLRRDPLGRQLGNSGQFGTDQNLLQGADVYRRAEEILDEIRRRAGELARPEAERDYLRRLLDRF